MKLMTLKHAFAFLLMAVLFVITGCANDESVTQNISGKVEQEVLNYQGTAGSVTLPELAEDLGYLAPIKLNYVGSTASGPESIQTAATGDTDFGGAFNGAIIKLSANGAPLKAVIGYYGSNEDYNVGYYVLEDSRIQSARDLIGKKVGVNTVGAHFEIVLKEYLSQQGLSEEEIKQVTLVTIPPVNLEQTLRNNQIDVAVMSGIVAERAKEKEGVRLLFSDYDLFGTFTAGSYVFTERFIKENPKTVKKFVEGIAKAIEWSETTPREEVIARFESIMEKRNRNENTENLKYWKGYGVAAEGGYIKKSEFQVWLDWLEDTEEIKKGKMQVEDLYTNEYTPFKEN